MIKQAKFFQFWSSLNDYEVTWSKWSHIVTVISDHTLSYWSHLLIAVKHCQCVHIRSQWSHIVTKFTHGHSCHIWSQWSHMVTVVTHGHSGHSIWLSLLIFWWLTEGEGKRWLIDLLASPQVKTNLVQRPRVDFFKTCRANERRNKVHRSKIEKKE